MELKTEIKNEQTPLIKKDIYNLIEISIKMRNLLQECRKVKLPISIAKKIDDILKEIDYL